MQKHRCITDMISDTQAHLLWGLYASNLTAWCIKFDIYMNI